MFVLNPTSIFRRTVHFALSESYTLSFVSLSLKMEGSVEETAKAVSDLTMDSEAPGESQSKKYVSFPISLATYLFGS